MEHLEFLSVHYKLGGVQKARSVRSFAAPLNLTNSPDRSSLVQLYFRFVHVDGSTSTSPSAKNQIIARISDKTQNKCFMKKKYTAFATASAAATLYSGVITFELVVLPSWHCFWNPEALDPRLCLVRNVR